MKYDQEIQLLTAITEILIVIKEMDVRIMNLEIERKVQAENIDKLTGLLAKHSRKIDNLEFKTLLS